MMIIIIIIIIIIVLKGAIRDFYNLLTARRIVSNTYAHGPSAIVCKILITCNTSSAYRVPLGTRGQPRNTV